MTVERTSVSVDSPTEIKPFKDISEVPQKLIKCLTINQKITSTKEKFIKELLLVFLKEFLAPSEIQKYCWPALAKGYDFIGVAETGSGKTLGFMIPLLAKIAISDFRASTKPQLLVIAPTRELAIQIHEVIAQKIKMHGMNSICIYGGVPKTEQIKILEKYKPLVVIGTPGRIIDLMNDKVLNLSSIKSWVLDEADRMLDMGFEPELREMASVMKHSTRQTVMFSATWPISVQTVATRYLKKDRVMVTVSENSTSKTLKAASSISQIVEVIDERQKDHRVIELLKEYHNSIDSLTILFVLYKKEAARILELCRRHKFEAVCLHGDMSQKEREQAFKSFKEREYRLLIATDVAARGLDIPSVSTVINYTFPLTIEDYVHRIGRTGRAGKKGHSHTLFTSKENKLAAELVAQLKASNQPVPKELIEFGGSTKRKEHSEYGAFYKEIDTSIKSKHFKFDNEDE